MIAKASTKPSSSFGIPILYITHELMAQMSNAYIFLLSNKKRKEWEKWKEHKKINLHEFFLLSDFFIIKLLIHEKLQSYSSIIYKKLIH